MPYSRNAEIKRILDEAYEAISRLKDDRIDDDEPCKCGHPYHRHFDWDYNDETLEQVGCKYCVCSTWRAVDA